MLQSECVLHNSRCGKKYKVKFHLMVAAPCVQILVCPGVPSVLSIICLGVPSVFSIRRPVLVSLFFSIICHDVHNILSIASLFSYHFLSPVPMFHLFSVSLVSVPSPPHPHPTPPVLSVVIGVFCT